jgi:hypothetical protein
MPKVDFSNFYYYPSLQSTDAEHQGYRQLSNEDKDQIIPIFELSQRPKEKSLAASMDVVRASAGKRPFILDLCRHSLPAPTLSKNPKDADAAQARYEEACAIQAGYNAALAAVLNPNGGFQAWRDIVAKFPNAIPSIQYREVGANKKQILRQAAALSRGGQSIAIRVSAKDDPEIGSFIPQIMAVLDSPDQLLIVVDTDYGRVGISNRANFASGVLATVSAETDLEEAHLLRAVCLSSSFPQLSHDDLKAIDNLDWNLWAEARVSFPFMFGDYGATRRYVSTGFIPFEWRATAVLPLDVEWIAYRDPNQRDEQGWVEGAQQLKASEHYNPPPDTWGIHVIEQAAGDDLDEINNAGTWYAAKVNIHLHRQIRHARKTIQEYEEEEGG